MSNIFRCYSYSILYVTSISVFSWLFIWISTSRMRWPHILPAVNANSLPAGILCSRNHKHGNSFLLKWSALFRMSYQMAATTDAKKNTHFTNGSVFRATLCVQPRIWLDKSPSIFSKAFQSWAAKRPWTLLGGITFAISNISFVFVHHQQQTECVTTLESPMRNPVASRDE